MFKDKNLLVTGGTGSIGSSICSYFNDNNCKEIYSTTTNINKIKSDQNYIKFKELDLNNIENLNLDELFDFDIDFLVLNAGLNKDNIFLRMSLDDWKSVINVNLNSSFHLLKHFVKKMVKKRFGKIVFISSVVAHTGNPGQTNYSASKAAISGLVKSGKDIHKKSVKISFLSLFISSVKVGFLFLQRSQKNFKHSVRKLRCHTFQK